MDLTFLIVFGIIAVFMCYSNSVAEYATWGVALLIGALVWNGIRWVRGNAWGRWLWLNLIHLVVMVTFLFAVYGWEWLGFPPIAEIPQIWAWIALLVANILILACDFKYQLSQLSQ